jgi:two-component system probable response regulator PhcQ
MTEVHRAFPVLYVDDEPQNLLAFRYAMEDRFSILTATGGPEAVALLEREDVAVLMCDQRMPGMTGAEVCQRARELKPDVVRIMVGAHRDPPPTPELNSRAQVLRYLTKPWHNDELAEVLAAAIEMVRLRRLVDDIQKRALRGTHPPALQGMSRQIANELQPPLAALRMNTEQVGDLLSAALLAAPTAERTQLLLEDAQRSNRASQLSIAMLSDLAMRLAGYQALAALPNTVSADVVRVVRSAARILGPVLDSRLHLQLVLTGSPVVTIDPGELGQILINLVMNAALALSDASSANPGQITIQVNELDRHGEIVVLDNGPGIAPDLLERVFDPYVTSRVGTAGLGLSVVRHLVVQATGTVQAENRAAGGTRVSVRLPLVR